MRQTVRNQQLLWIYYLDAAVLHVLCIKLRAVILSLVDKAAWHPLERMYVTNNTPLGFLKILVCIDMGLPPPLRLRKSLTNKVRKPAHWLDWISVWNRVDNGKSLHWVPTHHFALWPQPSVINRNRYLRSRRRKRWLIAKPKKPAYRS